MKYGYDFNDDGTFDLVDSSAGGVGVPPAYRDACLAGQPVRGRVKDGSGATSPDYLTTVNGHVITVTTLDDVGTARSAVGTAGVSLRGAVASAEADPDADHVLSAPSLFTGAMAKITPIPGASLTAQDSAFLVSTPVVITGPSGTRGPEVVGKGPTVNYRAFTVAAGGSLTAENLNARDSASAANAPAGGAIYAAGPLTVRRSAFFNNTAIDRAGAVVAYGGGGAVAALEGSTLVLRHATVHNNAATIGAGVHVRGTSAAAKAAAAVSNTILYGNTGNGAADFNQIALNNGAAATGANNLIGSVRGTPVFTGTPTGNPFLALPARNGGPTMTPAITPAGPAYNAAAAVAGLTTDQRGVARAAGTPDAGAYEVQLAVVTAPLARTVFPGNTALFTAAAAGVAQPAVRWQASTDDGRTFADAADATLTTLTFAAASAQNNNLYRAVFTNGEGTVATAAARLTVPGTVTLANGTFAVSRSAATNAVTVTGTAGSAAYPLAQLSGFAVRNASVTFNSDPGLSNATAGTVALGVAADSNAAFADSQHPSTLTANGRVTVAAGGNRVLRAGGLTPGGSGTLDLNDNALVYDYATAAGQTNAVRTLIAKGRANGAWTGTGLTSTAARTRSGGGTTLGIMDANAFKAMYGPAAPFAGETVGDAVLVKYGLYGDTDFSGSVNFDDYVLLQTNMGQSI